MVNSEIFKTYDIRGVYGVDWNEDDAYNIARAYATFLIFENPDKNEFNIVVGRDMRLSSPILTKSVIKGLIDSGINVIDIGLASTPTFYFAVASGGYDGGLQVSASHNQKEYNGLKAVRAGAAPISLEDGLDKIRDLVFSKNFKSIKKTGSCEEKNNFLSEIVDYSLSYYDFSGLKDLKIVADAANAMGALDIEALFAKLKKDITKMNFNLDGTFPVHQADPFQEKNIKDLKQKVLEERADLGIATDGDGDRIFFIDNEGELIPPAILRGLLAKIVLRHKPGAKIGYDIRPGKITKDMIIENGGIPFVTKAGHSLIKKASIEQGAEFSGESSGHFFFRTEYGFFETPLIVILALIKEISKLNLPIAEIIAPLKRYVNSGELNFKAKDKENIVQQVIKKYKPNAKEISDLDGITIEHDKFWFNVRLSNTEPLLRLTLEAVNKDEMEKRRDELTEYFISLGAVPKSL